jgi:tRNA A-37 threonylcarbamoyl transferase component Bud32
LKLDSFLGSKHHALIRIVSSFSPKNYRKPLKFDHQNSWYLPCRRFVFPAQDPEGEIKICLSKNLLPPLPTVPITASNCHEEGKSLSLENFDPLLPCCPKEKAVIANLTIPVSFSELKQSKNVERWFTVEMPGISNKEAPQVRVSLHFNYVPSRLVASMDSLTEKYDIEDTLGAGVSVVKKGVNKFTKKPYAVKYLQKSIKGQTLPRHSLDNEIDLLSSISHPNIVNLYEAMEDPSTIYLIMELVSGSDLYDIMEILGNLRPTCVVAILKPLINALSYLHSRGIVHHDLKPENIIIDYTSNTLKLTDFGSAKLVSQNHAGALGGTLNYMAPEVLQNMRGGHNKCNQAVDIWSLGVITYLLISGVHPFDSGKSHENILNRIISGKFDYKSGPVWEKAPKECKDFIKRCIVVDPKKRATITELMKHPWIVGKKAALPAVQSPKGCGGLFTEQECDRISKEKAPKSSSCCNSMSSLLELFSHDLGVSRS